MFNYRNLNKALIKSFFPIHSIDNPEMMSPDEMSNRVFKEMDINHDSKITKEEFIQVCLKNYTISETLARKVLKVISTDV